MLLRGCALRTPRCTTLLTPSPSMLSHDSAAHQPPSQYPLKPMPSAAQRRGAGMGPGASIGCLPKANDRSPRPHAGVATRATCWARSRLSCHRSSNTNHQNEATQHQQRPGPAPPPNNPLKPTPSAAQRRGASMGPGASIGCLPKANDRSPRPHAGAAPRATCWACSRLSCHRSSNTNPSQSSTAPQDDESRQLLPSTLIPNAVIPSTRPRARATGSTHINSARVHPTSIQPARVANRSIGPATILPTRVRTP